MPARLSQRKLYFLLYAPLIAWMGVIYYLSSVPGSGVAYEMPRTLFLERKGAHVSEYCILTLLWIRFFTFYLPKNKVRALTLAAFLAVSYAISDEIHQLFVFARTGRFTDVLIDSGGVVLALIFFLIFSKTLLRYTWFYPKLLPKRSLPRVAKKSTIKKKKSVVKKVTLKKII
jgi:VanZ family protein